MKNHICFLNILGICAIVSIISFYSSFTAASSGTVNGTMEFYQNQGNYCPTSMNCTGARYSQAQYHQYRPVKNVKVYIVRDSDQTVIGQGQSDTSGDFSIYWTDPSSSGNVSAHILWPGEHKDKSYSRKLCLN